MELKPGEFMLWYRDNPKREISTDVSWATQKFEIKYDQKPTRLLVPELMVEDYQALGLELEIKPQRGIGEKYFGIQ